jgi:hypothetical protein
MAASVNSQSNKLRRQAQGNRGPAPALQPHRSLIHANPPVFMPVLSSENGR